MSKFPFIRVKYTTKGRNVLSFGLAISKSMTFHLLIDSNKISFISLSTSLYT